MRPIVVFLLQFFSQAYCNIIAGACFGLGLKFAGSADQDAFETLLYFCHMFSSLAGKSIAELAGKPTIETCLNVLLLSASMVKSANSFDLMQSIKYSILLGDGWNWQSRNNAFGASFTMSLRNPE